MKVYLHLSDAGLILPDLAVRLYTVTGEPINASGLTLDPLATETDYALDGLPDVPGDHAGMTLTFEQPAGVFHAYRFGVAESQPSGVIISVREVMADPLNNFQVAVFRDGVEQDSLSASQIAVDGEYIISGWDSPSPFGEAWSVRWIYNGQVYPVQWTGTAVGGSLNGPGILAAVETMAIAAGLPFPLHVTNQALGRGYLAGMDIALPTDPTSAEWCEISMPNLDETQITSGKASALRGNMQPTPLLRVRYFGPIGTGAFDGLSKARMVANLFAGNKIEDSLGGVEFEAGVSSRILGVGPSATLPGQFFQVQCSVRGMMLYREAA